MQVILEMQAKHEVAVQKHDEQLARLEAAVAKHDEQLAQNSAEIQAVTDLVGRLAPAEIRLVERVDHLAERINQLAEKTDPEIGELREAQAYGEYKLNALIETADKLVRRNGGEPS